MLTGVRETIFMDMPGTGTPQATDLILSADKKKRRADSIIFFIPYSIQVCRKPGKYSQVIHIQFLYVCLTGERYA
jgi:hypothetical protein